MTGFDERAKTWDSDPVRIKRARAVAEGIRSKIDLASDLTALEYGCVTGLLSFALQPYLSHITLADSSDGMLAVVNAKIASQGIDNMTSIKLDLVTDPLPPNKYQLIYTLMTLHHIIDTDKILQDFFELLESSGYLCIADLDKEDGSFHDSDFPGHKGFDRVQLGKKSRKIGFRHIDFSTIFHMEKGEGNTQKSYTLFLMFALK